MKKGFLLLSLLFSISANAQQAAASDAERGMGMNVVISVLAIIFVGIILFLISLERKLSRLEKEIDK